jgi:hypothetical protein
VSAEAAKSVGDGAAPTGAPQRFCLCGELATGYDAGVSVSQEDRPSGSLAPLLTRSCLLHLTSKTPDGPLLEPLLSCVKRGWQVKILPWVVGVLVG